MSIALPPAVLPAHDASEQAAAATLALRRAVARFAAPSRRRALGQLASTFLPLLATLGLMYAALGVSILLTLGLAVVAAGFVVRVFIIQHDCGHGAFFRSRRANDWVGRACSLFTLTPYSIWARQHAGHHGNWNNLDRRWSGADIYSTCLTTTEYRALTRAQRRRHRAMQHPLVALLLLPPVIFLLLYRVPFDTPPGWQAERRQVLLTNLALAVVFVGLAAALGWRDVLLVQLPISVIASIFGVWLFSLQHRFEAVVWARQPEWSQADAALHGSSYLQLPRVLQWFSGNIGFHHIHHLNPRVPNYRLQSCFDAVAGVRAVPRLSLRAGLQAFRYCLWDEARGRMVRLRDLAF